MDFKKYYHDKLNEEGVVTHDSLDDDAVQSQPKSQPVSQIVSLTKTDLVAEYVKDTSLKLGLRQLGDDIGEGIFDYATKLLVQPTDFKSDDDYTKYCNDIRDGVAEKYNKTLSELLTQIGLFIDNKVHNVCPNK